jgi:hypothetical protein
LRNISADARSDLTAAINNYDPLFEAVVVIAGERFSKILIAGDESSPDGLRV